MSVVEATTPEEYQSVRNQQAGPENQSGLVAIDYSAEWCSPCKMIAPAYAELAKKYNGVVTFVHVDVDTEALVDEEDLQDIRGVPTFKFFKNGKQVADFSGANIQKVQSLVEEHCGMTLRE